MQYIDSVAEHMKKCVVLAGFCLSAGLLHGIFGINGCNWLPPPPGLGLCHAVQHGSQVRII